MGEVFLGCVDKECKKPVAIKISNGSNRYEYKIGKRIEKLSGMRMYAYQECVNEKKKKYSIIYTENKGKVTCPVCRKVFIREISRYNGC